LHEHLKVEPGDKDQVRLKVGEGEPFADLLIEDILRNKCFDQNLIQELNDQLKLIKEDVLDEAKLDLWIEKLHYTYEKEDITNLETDSQKVFALGEQEIDKDTISLRQAMLYPVCRKLLTANHINIYLEKTGWLEK
jgi:hypothetical protein